MLMKGSTLSHADILLSTYLLMMATEMLSIIQQDA